MKTKGQKPKAKIRRRSARDEIDASGESLVLQPILPRNITNPTLFRSAWNPVGLPKEFEKARELVGINDFFGGVHRVRSLYFNDGFRFVGDSGAAEVREWARGNGFWAAARRVAADIWREWLMCDNAVVFWTRPTDETKLPPLCVLDCEAVRYSNTWGQEKLELVLKRKVLTDQEKAALQPKWVAGYTEGKPVLLDPSRGEFFRVLTPAKLGEGLARPSLVQILQRLSIRELLNLADWSGAYQHKDVVRHVKGGYAITMGDHAGEKTHHLTDVKRKEIERALKAKSGPYDAVTNFDVAIGFAFLDPGFFSDEKFASTRAALRAWGGAAVMIYEAGVPSPMLMQAFGVEGRAHRANVGFFLEELLNDPDYCGTGEFKPPKPIRIGWNPNSFRETKMMLEWLRFAHGSGLASTQTARDSMDLDHELEGDRLKAELAQPERNRPTFEPKQGMLANGGDGRPVERPET